MKIIKKFFVVAGLMALMAVTMIAKPMAVPKMYMFGFAASFNDTIVHFTDIQEVDSVWVDSRNKFLLGRDTYSYQLRSFLADSLGMPRRTCVIFYAQKRKDIDKEYSRLTKLYYLSKPGNQHYDVHRLEKGQFVFEAVNMGEVPVVEESSEAETAQPAASDKKKPKKSRQPRGK